MTNNSKSSFVPSLRQASSVKLTVSRELPIPGKILVKPGQIVSASEIVAKAEMAGEILILRIAENLGIDPLDFEKSLKVSAGDNILEKQVLCEHRGLFGLFNSKFNAPQSGSVDFISKTLGHIGLRLPSTVLELNAYCGGRVTKIEKDKTVELETTCTLVQGIFGVGGERQGILHVLDIAADKKLEIQDLPSDVKGKILVGGTLPSAGVLDFLSKSGATGLVTGGIDDLALADFLGFDLGLAITGNEKISMSLMVTEGFGNLALSQRVIKLLKPLNSKFACMNGTTQIRAGAIRPELVVPEDPDNQPKNTAESLPDFSVGAKVRLIRVPYFGLIGTIITLPADKQKLENGVSAKVAEVLLDEGEKVVAPIANIELL